MTDREFIVLSALVHDLPSLSPDVAAALRPWLDGWQDEEAMPATRRAEECVAGPVGAPLAEGGLRSIWSFVSLAEAQPALEHRWHPMAPLAATSAPQAHLFPVAAEPKDDREAHLRAFAAALGQVLSAVEDSPFPVRLHHLLAVLQQYLWCLPAHSQDVALYDHLRLTAAVAACQHANSGASGEGFVLAAGDLSGIQDYIFDIANVGTHGVARRLRARSLYISLLSEVVTHHLCQRFELPPTNVLMSSGGKFYLLLPAAAGWEGGALAAAQSHIDEWLLDEFNGEVGLNLAWVSVPEQRLRGGFSAAASEVNALLAVRKRQRLRPAVSRDGAWIEDRFIIRRDFWGEGACRSCGKQPASDAEGFCRRCTDDEQVGGQLPVVRYLSFYRGAQPRGRATMRFLDDYYVVPAGRPPSSSEAPYLVVKLNDPGLDDLRAHPATFRFLANYVPRTVDEGGRESTKTLEAIAAASRGRALLGHLKADVDYLGVLFAQGLRDADQHCDTAAHHIMLSRELDLFFSGWLQHRLEAPPDGGEASFEDTYTVFSGGDDLYVIGPWDGAMPLAREIREAFARFVGHNPHVSLSAGVLLARDRYPIARAARDVEEVLEQAKEDPSEGPARNRLAMLGDVLAWDEVPRVLAEVRELAQLSGDAAPATGGTEPARPRRGPTSALLYDLVWYGQMYRAYKRGEVAALRYKALFAYNLARVLRQGDQSVRQWADRLMQDLNDVSRAQRMQHMALVATCALFLRRRREET